MDCPVCVMVSDRDSPFEPEEGSTATTTAPIEGTPCVDCNRIVCTLCVEHDDYPKSEWIHCRVHCDTCWEVVCCDCVQMCMNCLKSEYADEDDSFFFCKKCCPAGIRPVGCEAHSWTTCPKREDDEEQECGECDANRNCAGKMGVDF